MILFTQSINMPVCPPFVPVLVDLAAQMRLFSWNVNGVRAVIRKGALQAVVEAEAPDMLCLQETKVPASEAATGLAGYYEYWNPAEKKGYAGTAILSKVEPISVNNGLPGDIQAQFALADDGYGDPNTEGRVLTAEYEKFYLVTVYTPNAKDDLTRIPLRSNQWDPAFLAYCRQLETQKPVVFCGDLNVAHTPMDLENDKSNVGRKGFTMEERAGFQAFIDAGFIDTLRIFRQGKGHYTWWSLMKGARERNVGWRIDYFLVSASLREQVLAAEIHPNYLGSDHCPISLTLDF